ncbi:MAG TPA: hypothetical protein VFY09_06280 [Flavobacteriaceae bacterium]|nr:hypothetical protein [Flavobacteriaceae bacterium]
MKKYHLYLITCMLLILTSVKAQETFEHRVREIADKIEKITKQEKEALKIEVEAVNEELKKGTLTELQADEKKLKLAEQRAKQITEKVSVLEKEITLLVQEKVDGKINDEKHHEKHSFTFSGMKSKEDKIESKRKKSSTTSQFVFAFGLNNLMTDNSVQHSDYRYWGSHFYEFGVTGNKRLFKNDNLLHLKYGLSLMYNNLRPNNDQYFIENGKQTILTTNSIDLQESRFKNVNLVAPIHLEFDFSGNKRKSDAHKFKTHESFRIGLGGFMGTNLKTKQILTYRDLADNKVTEKTKGDFNVNDFIYGLSAYMGYEETSLYIKYDLNPLFKSNVVDQNNISLGIRFDLN